jgi:hypothetical protein
LTQDGTTVDTTETDADGKYLFHVAAGVYTVRITSGNFAADKPLAAARSTTGGQEQTKTVVDAMPAWPYRSLNAKTA